MGIFKDYMQFSENLANVLNPKPLVDQDLSKAELRKIKWAGAIVCLWVYVGLTAIIFIPNLDALRVILSSIYQYSQTLLIALLLITMLIHLIVLFAAIRLGASRSLTRLTESSLKKLDEWETSQSLKISHYSARFALGTIGYAMFVMLTKWFFGGPYSMPMPSVIIILVAIFLIGMIGGCTLWAWQQKPLNDEPEPRLGLITKHAIK